MTEGVNNTFKDAPPPGAIQECPLVVSKVITAYFAKKIETGPPEDKKTPVNVSFEKLQLSYVGDKAFIIVETSDLKDATVSVEILGSKNITFIKPDDVVTVMQAGVEKSSFTAKVGEWSNKTQYANAISLVNKAIIEVELSPLKTNEKKEWGEKIESTTEKVAFLHLRVKTQAPNEIIYANEDENILESTKDKGIYLNKQDGWFKLYFCDCGKKYESDITCTRYNTSYGPVYWGNIKLENYTRWDDLINNKIITTEEKEIFVAMSANEGKLDSVQSYDSEIVTIGAMQKTINPSGYGELPIQMWHFKQKFPEKYKGILENCQWKIEEIINYGKKNKIISTSYRASYKGITGSALKSKIREGFTKNKNGTSVPCPPLEPLINLCKDIDYQRIQIEDFAKRLNENVLQIKPSGYSSLLNVYLKSKLGKATALDHHINRPGYVASDFGGALKRFHNKHPKVSIDPGTWGDEHSNYEQLILDDYGKNRRGTDMPKRYNDLKKKL